MNKERSYRRLGGPAISICAVLICIAIAFGHGGEKHDSTITTEQVPVDSLASLQNAARDSIYVTIQREFASLASVFEKGCFDCHTTKTAYPWYYKLPFVKSMIDDDVAEAKKHLDMSEGFPFGGHGKPADDLAAIREEVVDGEMPPMRYRTMHWSAQPSESKRDSIVAWVERGLASLASIGVFPTDSDNPATDAESVAIYVCPMHPDVTSNNQDNCRICGMALKIQNVDSLSVHDNNK